MITVSLFSFMRQVGFSDIVNSNDKAASHCRSFKPHTSYTGFGIIVTVQLLKQHEEKIKL